MNVESVAIHQKLISGDIPQLAYFYDGNGNMQYICIGGWGAALTDFAWKIFKLSYDANNNLSTVQSTHKNNQASARVTATYG